MNSKKLMTAAVLGLAVACRGVCAQAPVLGSTLPSASASSASASASAAASASPWSGNDTLYQALGGQVGLKRLTDDFLVRLMADSRMIPFFRDIDAKVFKTQLTTQLCEVSGGPCRFKGKDMKTIHSEQDIRKTDFLALVEVLQHSMDAQGIAFADQNRLLARLAPMHRDIINTP